MKECIALLTLIAMIFVISPTVGAADEKMEGEKRMGNIEITAVPGEYKRSVASELQGSLTEVSYSVNNYINQARQLVTNQNISSEKAGRETVKGEPITKRFNIYLPVGYDKKDQNTRYNVLYLLHGVGGNRYEWLNNNEKIDNNYIICNIFDNLIARGDIDPLIVVFPEGRSAYDWEDTSFNSEGTNILGFYYFDYELKYDLIPFIESHYKTYADISNNTHEGIEYNRMHRAIAGLSMGGMQVLNLTFGGYRYDSMKYTKAEGAIGNGLAKTVPTPGMEDLFAYVGAFSNAPTSSAGSVLGTHLSESNYKMPLLYITCGGADGIARDNGYKVAVKGLKDVAGDKLLNYYQILLKDGVHNFKVWNNGAFNFIRLSFRKEDKSMEPNNVKMTLASY